MEAGRRWMVGEPRLQRNFSGRWMAVSDDRATVCIGVEGETPQEARDRFFDEMVKWERLCSVEP